MTAQQLPERIGLIVDLHRDDYLHLEAAASATKTDIEDFAALVIYQRSKETVAEYRGTPLVRHADELEARNDHDRHVSRASA